jgi:hypothetical protein
MRNRVVWLTAFLLIVFIGIGPSHAQEIENLLDNGGFEDGAVAPWTEYGGATLTVVQELQGAAVPEDPIEGDYCLHVVVPNPGVNFYDFGLKHAGHTFEAGKKYTLSAFVKVKEGTLQINFKPELDGDPWTGYGEQVFTMTDEWAEYYVTTPVFTADVSPADIMFHIGFDAGDFWVDGVRWYEGDYVPSPLDRPLAGDPNPPDGSIYENIWASLQWTPGDFAVSHNVYMGDSFADVEAGTGGTFLASVPENYVSNPYLIVGIIGYPFPEGLADGTTYYWRIDEVNDLHPDSPWKGNVWSFTVPPKTAYTPSPADGAQFTDPQVTLNWEAGFGTVAHHVYFGDNRADVEAGTPDTYKGEVGLVTPTYTPPGPLELEKTYYWRIDEFTGIATNTGDVWSFTTTLPGLGRVVQEVWNNIPDWAVDNLRNDPRYPHSPDETTEITAFDTGVPAQSRRDHRDYGVRHGKSFRRQLWRQGPRLGICPGHRRLYVLALRRRSGRIMAEHR